MLKVSDIRELIRLLDETSIHELKIETDDITVTMKKAEAGVPVSVQTASAIMPTAAVTMPVETVAMPAPVAAKSPEQPSAKEETGYAYIKSPMVGTFYRASSPTTPPYVEVGAKVNAKTVVCIVEAMKLMNEIEAEVQGEIVELMAENGHLVEYGQPLFKVKTE